MDKKPRNSTSIVKGAQWTNHSEYNPEQTNICLGSHRYHREPYQEMLVPISRHVSSKNATQIPWTGKLRKDNAEWERSYAQGVEHSWGGRGPWAAGAGDKRNEGPITVCQCRYCTSEWSARTDSYRSQLQNVLGECRVWWWWGRSQQEQYGSVPVSICKALVLFLV